MFDVFYSGKKPNLFAHERQADSVQHAQSLCRTRHFWWITYLAELDDWDWLYEPKPWQAHQRHAWPSQHQKDSGVYLVPRDWAGETNYHASPVITRKQNMEPWITPDEVDCESWDYSWHPDPSEPPYIHEFATEWHDQGGPVYTDAGATQRKHVTTIRARLTQSHDNRWHTLTDCAWDYSWRPHPLDPPYIYVFGNQWWPAEKFATVEYHVPGATERKFVSYPKAELLIDTTGWTSKVDMQYTFDHSWQPDPGDPPMTYVFGNQWWPAEKMPTVSWTHPDATDNSAVKYMSYPRATLAPNSACWEMPADVADVDTSWVPDPGDPPYIYQFATQHQKTGGPRYTVPGATETKYLAELKITAVGKATAVYEIDHLDGYAGSIPNTTKRIRYFDNYRDTLVRLAKSIGTEHEYVWVCSSICDYTNFDFSWHPEQWQNTMLHVFPSNEQKFGDTFYMHVPTFAERAERKALLEWYDVNFVTDRTVPRRAMPVVVHTADTHVDLVKATETLAPLVVYANQPVSGAVPTVPLWREETKTIVPLDAAASTIIVPRSARPYIKTQLYDYPYINKSYRNTLTAQAQDIVFISYDEPEADRNWQILHTKFPNSKRVHGIAGMELALEAAADVSTTPWYWAVFAKTELAPEFDFSFVPDYMQQPKHYIFNCLNMVNSLEYGHMGMVLYNCRGIRDTNRAGNFGLDYTLSFPHESIPILSCLGRFNTTPYHTWRTAFRETAKLAFFESQQSTIDGQYRLDTWMDQAQGDHAEWCLRGAQDGYEFFETTSGALDKLKQSFKWEWLRSYFEQRYGDLK